ncbi:MAG: hypothetical protein JZU65_22640 [Chlorobium sp.]|nr:hypothetical protein [Chlorobium sp.]
MRIIQRVKSGAAHLYLTDDNVWLSWVEIMRLANIEMAVDMRNRIRVMGLISPHIFLPPEEYKKVEVKLRNKAKRAAKTRLMAGIVAGDLEHLTLTSRPESWKKIRPLGSWERRQLNESRAGV